MRIRSNDGVVEIDVQGNDVSYCCGAKEWVHFKVLIGGHADVKKYKKEMMNKIARYIKNHSSHRPLISIHAVCQNSVRSYGDAYMTNPMSRAINAQSVARYLHLRKGMSVRNPNSGNLITVYSGDSRGITVKRGV